MALYDGFFDAVENEETGEYDRAYSSGDFTGYFANTIGSGVCIHDNPDSFLVRLEDGAAVVSSGYLFIQGYWLKNDADYTVELPTAATYAIVAHLNRGQRLIELEARSVAQAYPDALVLAIVSPTSAEDTRHNTDICGTIDTAGELSGKVEWALNYIDNEIESKLAEAEQAILAQEQRLDAKIAQVQAVADSIVPPPIGSIKFSASEDVGDEWLRCDGSFINEADYPELVAALGKLTPGVDEFYSIPNELPSDLSNGMLLNGYMWAFSQSTSKLYGVPTGEGIVKEISVSGVDDLLPIAIAPIWLTIYEGEIFLAQRETANYGKPKVFYSYAFAITGSSISLDKLELPGNTSSTIIAAGVPYVGKIAQSEPATYYIAYWLANTDGYNGYTNGSIVYAYWAKGNETEITLENYGFFHPYQSFFNFDSGFLIVPAFSKKNKGYLPYVKAEWTNAQTNPRNGRVLSVPEGFIYSGATKDFSRIDLREWTTIPVTDAISQIVMKYGITENREFEVAVVDFPNLTGKKVSVTSLTLPSRAKVFADAMCYLPDRNVWMFFVSTGLVFSDDVHDAGKYGYLDTTDVMGIITKNGYLEYDQAAGILYLMGIDTANKVKIGALKIHTLYDYANDGAWLPMIASDGVPAYIKATGDDTGGGGGVIPDPVPMQITVTIDIGFAPFGEILFNGAVLGVAGTYTRNVSASGTFTVGVRRKSNSASALKVKMNGTQIAFISGGTTAAGSEDTATFTSADFIANGITLQGTTD